MFEEIILDAPNIGDGEKRYVNQALETGYVSTVGPFVSQFEEKFTSYLKVSKAVSTQSGTAAIHMALHELGIGPGDEVIVPDLTFIASVNPVRYVGGEPVFADVDLKTWNIDPAEIKKKITAKTKAIIPVHLYGNPCDMDEIMDIAKTYKLYVIEDAAESLGASYKGRLTGTLGDLGCFSFNGNKIVTTGGGGMVAGNNEKNIAHIKFLVNQARDESVEYYHPEIGFNYRMTNIEAALGLAQMERLDELLTKKRLFNSIYRDELRDVKEVSFQEEYEGAQSSWWLTCVCFAEGIDLSAIQARLTQAGIPVRRVFMPVTEFPPFKKYSQKRPDNSRRIYERGLCLPGSTLNSAEAIHYVCKRIKELL